MSRARKNKGERIYRAIPQTTTLGLTRRSWSKNDLWAWDPDHKIYLLRQRQGWYLACYPSKDAALIDTRIFRRQGIKRWRDVVSLVTAWRLTS